MYKEQELHKDMPMNNQIQYNNINNGIINKTPDFLTKFRNFSTCCQIHERVGVMY
jgi:hypothetical protein